MNARAYESNSYPWNYHRVPRIEVADGRYAEHPARQSAIFVVHGMGQPQWNSTAAGLRLGFEDAHPKQGSRPAPTPSFYDGHWGDYADIEKTFPEDWARFNHQQQTLYRDLWRRRTLSAPRTVLWFIQQQLRLLSPRVLYEVGFLAWMLYLPLQFVSLSMLLLSAVFHPRLLTRHLGDVRLYLAPRGTIEHAIVQRIDRRVGKQFLRLIDLDWEFRPLSEDRLVDPSGEPVAFERVVWVAHSLGSVVSYNVLSDLFERAACLDVAGDEEQRIGVQRFRKRLTGFVTMGSPLDKVAFLYSDSLRAWEHGRCFLLASREGVHSRRREWWINFYHILDPVSGALNHASIRRGLGPVNRHIGLWRWPGWAHKAYWRDSRVVRHIQSQTYGRSRVRFRSPTPSIRLEWVFHLSCLLLAAILFAGCASTSPIPFEQYEEAAAAIHKSADKVLKVDYQWTQRTLAEKLAVDDAISPVKWIVEFPAGDFGWELATNDVLMRVHRTQRSVSELNAAFVDYTSLLSELAGGGVADSVQFDKTAEALNKRANAAASRLEFTGVEAELTLFTTAGMAVAREFLTHKRRRLLVEVVRENQRSIDRFANIARHGVRIVARDLKAEYQNHADRIIDAWPTASVARRRRLADDLLDWNADIIGYLEALGLLDESYADLARKHVELGQRAGNRGFDVGELLETAGAIDALYEEIKEDRR